MRKKCFIILLFLVGCNSNVEKDKITNKSERANNSERLKTIRYIINTYGFLELPYTFNYSDDDPCPLGGLYGKLDDEINQNVRRVIGNHFIGILPDTNTYFYILQGFAADRMTPAIITINKNDKELFIEYLIQNHCLETSLENICCTEYFTIEKNIKINYYSKHIYSMQSAYGIIDTFFEINAKKGYLSDSGKFNYYDIVHEDSYSDD